MEKMIVMARGAEAEVSFSEFLGMESVVKTRLPKRYRASILDDRIRLSRMRNETKLMVDARKGGVRTPVIYDIDIENCSIVMERVEGATVKSALNDDSRDNNKICRMIGEAIAGLHNARICHGDLTTSNMILTNDDTICILDISMGKYPAELEDLGVDIHLLERAFNSAHPELSTEFDEVLRSYSNTMKDARAVMTKVEDIKKRGRYT